MSCARDLDALLAEAEAVATQLAEAGVNGAGNMIRRLADALREALEAQTNEADLAETYKAMCDRLERELAEARAEIEDDRRNLIVYDDEGCPVPAKEITSQRDRLRAALEAR